MERKIKFDLSTKPYLCKNKRYKLSQINRIDDEYVLLARTFFRNVSLWTKNYIYKFEREEGETNKDLAFFKERVPFKLSKEDLESIEYKHKGGFNYAYTDEDKNITFGDYPKYPEYIKRIKEKVDSWRKIREEEREKEKEREKEIERKKENEVSEEANRI